MLTAKELKPEKKKMYLFFLKLSWSGIVEVEVEVDWHKR